MDNIEIDDFKCPNCLNFFNEIDNLPRLLPECGHTFCSKCIISFFSNSNEKDYFICPED